MPNKADAKKIRVSLDELKKHQTILDEVKGEWDDALEETENEEKQQKIQEDIDSLEEALSNLDNTVTELESLLNN